MNKGNTHYADSDYWIIRRAFNRGDDDGQIAAELHRRTGRVLGAEAVRKVRRQLGLRKKPAYQRWRWVPESWGLTA